MKRKLVSAVTLTFILFVGLLAISKYVWPVQAVAAPPTSNETVLVLCRFDGDPTTGVIVQAITRSANAPLSTASNCAQAVSDYMNLGYRIQAEDIAASGGNYPFPVFHLARP